MPVPVPFLLGSSDILLKTLIVGRHRKQPGFEKIVRGKRIREGGETGLVMMNRPMGFDRTDIRSQTRIMAAD